MPRGRQRRAVVCGAGLGALLALTGCSPGSVAVPPTVSPSPSSSTSAPQPTTSASPTTVAVLAQYGSVGPLVIDVQLRLGLPADGDYGSRTQAAVADFQRTHDLSVTGELDADTWAALQQLPSPCPSPAATLIKAAPGSGRTVALTFDDGPGPFTAQILQVLARFHVHATFFDTGLHDQAYPQLAHAVVAAGDLLANHTYNHDRNWGYASVVPAATQRLELVRTSVVQDRVLGHSPCFMRAPGDAIDAESLALVRSLGMSAVDWTTDTHDWRQPPYLSSASQQAITAAAELGVDLPHPVILLHAGKASHEPDCAPTGCLPGQVSSFRGNTVAALPTIIEFYLAHGYRFVLI